MAPSSAPTERSDLRLVPAGDPPASAPSSAAVEIDGWDAWGDAELVLALHEPSFSGTEDESHARLMAFADGRVLYRLRDADGDWHWYVERLSPVDTETLRAAVARDIAGTPAWFSCSAALHQRRSIIVVRERLRWRVHEGYALSACLGDVPPDQVLSYSAPMRVPRAVPFPQGFVDAYRRLVDFLEHDDRAKAEPWSTPRLWLVWIPHVGDYGYERDGRPWPDQLPTPPKLPPHQGGGKQLILQPVDGAFDSVLRSTIPLADLFEIDSQEWTVEVHRQLPGDDTLSCACSRPRRRCLPPP